MTDRQYNDLKLKPEQMVSPQDQATNAFKDTINADQQLSNELCGRAGGSTKKKKNKKIKRERKYSDKNPMYNRIRNPETNRYVNVDSTQGRKILRNYLENYSNIKNTM